MNIVELYSGTSDLTTELRKRGHNVIDIDWDESTPAKIHCDIAKLTYEDLCNLFPDHKVDFIWASPDCTTYSNAGLWKHRYPKTSRFECAKPKSEYAKKCDIYNQLLWENIISKAKCPYIVENPVGQYQYLDCITAPHKILIRYIDFGDSAVKPTNYFTNYPLLGLLLEKHPLYKKGGIKSIKGAQNRNGHLVRGKVPHNLIVALTDIIEDKIGQYALAKRMYGEIKEV